MQTVYKLSFQSPLEPDWLLIVHVERVAWSRKVAKTTPSQWTFFSLQRMVMRFLRTHELLKKESRIIDRCARHRHEAATFLFGKVHARVLFFERCASSVELCELTLPYREATEAQEQQSDHVTGDESQWV